jgi:hypothetical protein
MASFVWAKLPARYDLAVAEDALRARINREVVPRNAA